MSGMPDVAYIAKALSTGPTPICDYVEAALRGQPLYSLPEFFAAFGRGWRNHRDAWREPGGGILDIGSYMAAFREREIYTKRYGFAIPCQELIDTLKRYEPILEVGAGTGYLTRLARDRGVDMIATDAGDGDHHGFRHFAWIGRRVPPGTSWPVGHDLLLPAKTAVRRWPERNVFCSWPSLKGTWLRQAAKAMRPGRVLVVIEEECCADERTWDYLSFAFDQIGGVKIPCFAGLHDSVRIYRKRGSRGESWGPRQEEMNREHRESEVRNAEFRQKMRDGEPLFDDAVEGGLADADA